MTKGTTAGKGAPVLHISRRADLARLRRIALSAQGLLQASPFGRGLSGAQKAINHLGYIQIDTISVVQRAHHHVFRSRVPNYHPDMLHRLLARRGIFEYWAHAAAFLPMDDYRFSLPYKNAIKSGRRHWFRSRDKKLMADLLNRIRAEGPLRSRDVEESRGTGAGWWDWKPAKRALEQLYMQGDLMVAARDGFQKTYDLPERVLPADVDTRPPTGEEYAAHLIGQALRCHGMVSLKGITYQRRDAALRAAVKAQIDDGLARGDYQLLALNSGERLITRPQLLDEATPRAPGRLVILSPFDNAVIQRARLQSLFNFDYQIECYVPEAKREYGYFCLPLLYRDQFVGRLDAKAHRKQKMLEIKSLHFCEHTHNPDDVLRALAVSLQDFLSFQDCDALKLEGIHPDHLRQPLQAAVST